MKRENYLAQTKRYVAAMEELMGQRPQTILCMLNYAGAVHLETNLHPESPEPDPGPDPVGSMPQPVLPHGRSPSDTDLTRSDC